MNAFNSAPDKRDVVDKGHLMFHSKEDQSEFLGRNRTQPPTSDLCTSFAERSNSVLAAGHAVSKTQKELVDLLAAIDSLWSSASNCRAGSKSLQTKHIPRMEEYKLSLQRNLKKHTDDFQHLIERLEILLPCGETLLAAAKMSQQEHMSRQDTLLARISSLQDALSVAGTKKKSPNRSSPEKGKTRKTSPAEAESAPSRSRRDAENMEKSRARKTSPRRSGA